MNNYEGVKIEGGSCHIFFAFDVAYSIDLSRAEELLQLETERITLRSRNKLPEHLGFLTPPLKVAIQSEPIRVGDFVTDRVLEALLFDFGGISLSFKIPLECDFSKLPQLSLNLYGNDELLRHARTVIEDILSQVNQASEKPEISDLVEDYCLFDIPDFDRRLPLDEIVQQYVRDIAGALRAEVGKLSAQEEMDAMSKHLSYREDDILFFDWHAAILLQYTGVDDLRAVVEFANLELLEMRFLDRQLDRILDNSHKILSRQVRFPLFGWRWIEKDVRKLGRLQVDAASLFEGINASLKLFGDPFLARVYAQVSERFCHNEWDAIIVRKLAVVESVYQKLIDTVNQKRMEFLEIIIIGLFVISIGISLIPGFGH